VPSDGVIGIKLKRVDGQELTLTYVGPPQGEDGSIIEAFMRGHRTAAPIRRPESYGKVDDFARMWCVRAAPILHLKRKLVDETVD
jgi:hypothetical protein